MARIERKKILERFRAMAAKKQPIVGGGAGTGLSAKCEEAGAAADDRLAAPRHLAKPLQQCRAFKPCHRSPR